MSKLFRNSVKRRETKNKLRKSFRKLNKQFGGECDYKLRPDSLIDIPPEDKIEIRNKCYQLSNLYDWIITQGKQYLPEDEIKHDEKENIRKSYELAMEIKRIVPKTIIDNRDLIIQFISENSEILEKMLIQQYSHIHSYIPDRQEYVIDGFKIWALRFYSILKKEFDLIRSEYKDDHITIVSIGNSPYKFLRLIELFGKISNSNFIYLPYSGNFKKHNSEGKMEARQMTDLELYLERPEWFIRLNYQPTRKLKYFENMLKYSGLLENIDANHKIIFVDFLQSGLGCLSFMITIDKFLKPNNTLILALENPKANSHVDKLESPNILNDKLVLQKFPIKFIDLDYTDDEIIYKTFFIDDDVTSDRCVKSYGKQKWAEDYRPYWDEKMLNNCNIALLNMALVLKNQGLID
jgi:hypothetical protein